MQYTITDSTEPLMSCYLLSISNKALMSPDLLPQEDERINGIDLATVIDAHTLCPHWNQEIKQRVCQFSMQKISVPHAKFDYELT